MAGLYTRWFHRWALLLGWAVGMVYGTAVAYQQTAPNTKVHLVDGNPVTTTGGTRHFATAVADFPFTHAKVYIAVTAVLFNLVVAAVLTLLLRAVRAPEGTDETRAGDYYADATDERVLVTVGRESAGAEAQPGAGG